MLNQDQTEKLELYHKGKLSEDEIKELEKTVLENPELKAEAESLLDLYKGFNSIQLENFENDVKEWEQECSKELVKSDKKDTKVISLTSLLSRYRYAAAAAILLLLLPVGFLLFQNVNSSNGEKLFEANAEHYTAIQMNTRSSMSGDAPDPLQAIKDKGISFYNEEKYDEAIKQLNNYYTQTDEKHKTSDIKLYLALSYLFSGNTKDAVNFFTDILSKENNGNYKDAAEWYLALTYLKEMNVQKSLDLLTKIAETENHPYQSKAKTLLPEVKNLK
jgi:tetratricopeptide (TPR) repeat protein